MLEYILHPVFNIVMLLILLMGMYEVLVIKRKKKWYMYTIALLLIIFGGFRYRVGADANTYISLFQNFPIFTTYSEVFQKALFFKTDEEIEWIYVLLNKLIHDAGLQFYFVTIIMMILALSLKITTIYKNVGYPAVALFFYYMPQYFFEDCGQMRQGVGIAICVYSYRYIKERNLKMFLLMMYLGLGFHKTTIVFIPAYWLVRIPMNGERIFLAIVVSMILSPFKIYGIFGGLLNVIAPDELSAGFNTYNTDTTYGGALGFGLNDISKILFIILLIAFDKKGREKVLYYEYMRNLAVTGLCLYYILRGNSIFAVRLTGVYLFFLTVFTLPSILYAMKSQLKPIFLGIYTAYITLLFFNFARLQGDTRFNVLLYKNILWEKEPLDWYQDWAAKPDAFM